MSKKNLTYLIVLVVLGVLAFYLVKQQRTGTTGNLKEFAIEDTASITKVFIAAKANEQAQVTLEKGTDGWWMLNTNYRARKDLMQLVLDCAKRMEIKEPMPKPAVENVMKLMATSGTKVDFYHGEELIKTIYIGGTTQDELGTYMLLDGSDKPEIVHLPGFNGYLSPRFSANPADWRDKTLFGNAPQDIDNVTVNYTGNAKKSFHVKVVSEEIAQITSLAGDTAKGDIDGDFFRKFLGMFRAVQYDGLLTDRTSSQAQRDSIIATVPYCTITLVDKKGGKSEVSLHLFPKEQRSLYQAKTYDQTGNPIVSPEERLYCVLPNKKEVGSIQNYLLSTIMTDYSRFLKKK